MAPLREASCHVDAALPVVEACELPAEIRQDQSHLGNTSFEGLLPASYAPARGSSTKEPWWRQLSWASTSGSRTSPPGSRSSSYKRLPQAASARSPPSHRKKTPPRRHGHEKLRSVTADAAAGTQMVLPALACDLGNTSDGEFLSPSASSRDCCGQQEGELPNATDQAESRVASLPVELFQYLLPRVPSAGGKGGTLPPLNWDSEGSRWDSDTDDDKEGGAHKVKFEKDKKRRRSQKIAGNSKPSQLLSPQNSPKGQKKIRPRTPIGPRKRPAGWANIQNGEVQLPSDNGRAGAFANADGEEDDGLGELSSDLHGRRHDERSSGANGCAEHGLATGKPRAVRGSVLRNGTAQSLHSANTNPLLKFLREEEDDMLANGAHSRQRSPSIVLYKSEFQYLVAIARKHRLPLNEVRFKRQEFQRYDTTSGVGNSMSGCLSLTEFHRMVRQRFNLGADEPIPPHLVCGCSSAQTNEFNFEDFLLWSMRTAYTEERLVSDPKERFLRQVARDNGLALPDVEKVKAVFDSFDCDKSDAIDEEEFKNVIGVLMKAKHPSDIGSKKLKRFWTEVDTDGSGEISFVEFLLWYFRFMNDHGI